MKKNKCNAISATVIDFTKGAFVWILLKDCCRINAFNSEHDSRKTTMTVKLLLYNGLL